MFIRHRHDSADTLDCLYALGIDTFSPEWSKSFRHILLFTTIAGARRREASPRYNAAMVRFLLLRAGLGLVLSAFAIAAARAQQGPVPAVPQNTDKVPPPAPLPQQVSHPPASPAHRFWDRENVLLFSGISVFRGLDYASTRNMQARGREEILLPDDVVNNSAGFAALEAAATATSVGISYWLHRTGHHKVERWLSLGHIGVTGFGVARNYCLKSKHPAAPSQ